jgi:putative ABC transport system permease protein
MSWWRLMRADLMRSPMRMIFTSLSLITAFLLFGLLQPVRVMFNEGVELTGDTRLIVTPKHSVADMLPVNHATRIAQIQDVELVAHMTWFGGVYQDAQNFFPQFAVTPNTFIAINKEIQMSEEAANKFVDHRRAAIVGRTTAQRFGWQAGDAISLIPTIWHNREGLAWEFELVGVFTSKNEALLGNDGFYFSYPYFDEYRAFGNGTVGSFVLQVNEQATPSVTVKRIDAEFANSSDETRTQSAAEYTLSFARQVGDVGGIATIILIAVFFTLVMLTGHAMSRSVHERIAEVAVMRVFGFKRFTLIVLLSTEFVVLSVGAALLGIGIAYLITMQLEQAIPQVSQLGGISIGFQTITQGLILAFLIGLGVAVVPVARSVLRPIVPALRVEA